MKNTKYLYLILTLFFYLSCDLDPIEDLLLPAASFSFSNNNCAAPCTVSFTNTTQNAGSYSWDFGDGSSSTENSPSHEYISAGSYTVRLQAFGSAGSVDSSSQTVFIQQGTNENPSDTTPSSSFLRASFSITSISNNQFAPADVTFQNTSINATSFHWVFGDGTASFDEDPDIHSYMLSGQFEVELRVEDSEGNRHDTSQMINILQPITFNKSGSTLGLNVTVVQNQIGQYVVADRAASLQIFDTNGNFLSENTLEADLSGQPNLQKLSDGGLLLIMRDKVFRMDMGGNLAWSKSVLTGNGINGIELTNGNLAILGTDSNIDGFQLVLTDPSGNVLDQKGFPDLARDGHIGSDVSGELLIPTQDGGMCLAGRKGDNFSEADIYLAKLDNEGNIVWDKSFSKTGFEGPRSILQTQDGGYAVLGREGASYQTTGFILTVSSEGEELERNTIVTDNGDSLEPFDFTPTLDGGFAIVGYQGDFSNLFFAKMNREGEKVWEKDYFQDGYGGAIAPTLDGGFIVVGRAPNGLFLLKTDFFGNLN